MIPVYNKIKEAKGLKNSKITINFEKEWFNPKNTLKTSLIEKIINFINYIWYWIVNILGCNPAYICKILSKPTQVSYSAYTYKMKIIGIKKRIFYITISEKWYKKGDIVKLNKTPKI